LNVRWPVMRGISTKPASRVAPDHHAKEWSFECISRGSHRAWFYQSGRGVRDVSADCTLPEKCTDRRSVFVECVGTWSGGIVVRESGTCFGIPRTESYFWVFPSCSSFPPELRGNVIKRAVESRPSAFTSVLAHHPVGFWYVGLIQYILLRSSCDTPTTVRACLLQKLGRKSCLHLAAEVINKGDVFLTLPSCWWKSWGALAQRPHGEGHTVR